MVSSQCPYYLENVTNVSSCVRRYTKLFIRFSLFTITSLTDLWVMQNGLQITKALEASTLEVHLMNTHLTYVKAS